MRRSTFAAGASRLFNAVDFPNRSGQKVQEGFGAEADEVHPIPDGYHDEMARYGFLIASADELADEGYKHLEIRNLDQPRLAGPSSRGHGPDRCPGWGPLSTSRDTTFSDHRAKDRR